MTIPNNNNFYKDIFNQNDLDFDVDADNSTITNLQVQNISSIDPNLPITSISNIQAPVFIGNLQGNADTSTNSVNSIFFTGSLNGDVGGIMSSTSINPGVVTNNMLAGSIADSKLLIISTGGKVANSATTATNNNVNNAIVARDSSGNFSANIITASLNGNSTGFTGLLAGDITGPMSSTQIGTGVIVNADINASAGIVDTKLATISTSGKVANSATTATSNNIDGAIVSRNNTTGTLLGMTTLQGNLFLQRYPTGNDYRVISMDTGNSQSFIFANYPQLRDSFNISYNWYYPTGSATPVYPNTGQSTSRIALSGNAISFYTNLAVASAPIEYLRITNGSIATENGAIYIGNLTGNVTGNCSGSSSSFTGSLVGDIIGTMGATQIGTGVIIDSDINASAGILDTKLATISTPNKVANSANPLLATATNNNTVSTIVLRDASGNFSAGNITANITGNCSGSSLNFTGSLAGDIIGTMGATQIGTGVIVDADINASAGIMDTKLATISTANKIANSANPLLAAATSSNTASTLVVRNTTGNSTAFGQISTTNLLLTNGNPSGNLYNYISVLGGNSNGYIYGAYPVTDIRDGLNIGYNFFYNNGSLTPTIPITSAGTSRVQYGYGQIKLCVGATNSNPVELLRIDSGGTISTENGAIYVGNLTGNVTGNCSGSSATFTGSLAGDVIGTMGATQIANGVIVNSDINASAGIVDTKLATISTSGKVANSATTATNTNTANSIVLRDGSGNFSAGVITGSVTGSSSTFTGSLAGDVIGTMGATQIAAGVITNADINASAGIVDTKLNTISTGGKVANSATTATSGNTPNTVVLRDASGNINLQNIVCDTIKTNFITSNATSTLTFEPSATLNFNSNTIKNIVITDATNTIYADKIYTYFSNSGASYSQPLGVLASQVTLCTLTVPPGNYIMSWTIQTTCNTSNTLNIQVYVNESAVSNPAYSCWVGDSTLPMMNHCDQAPFSVVTGLVTLRTWANTNTPIITVTRYSCNILPVI